MHCSTLCWTETSSEAVFSPKYWQNYHFCAYIVPLWVIIGLTSGLQNVHMSHSKTRGKIWHEMRGIIHVILLKTLWYLWSQILQMRWRIILDIDVYRHPIDHTKLYTLFSAVFTVLLDRTFSAFYLYFLKIVIQCSHMQWTNFMQIYMQFWTHHSGRITCLLAMIVRLYQKTKHAKCEMYEFKNYKIHESIVIVLHFDDTSSVWVQSPFQYFCYAGKHQ